MNPNSNESKFMIGLRRLALEAEVVPACPYCQAPGFYMNDPGIQQGWPSCYDPTLMPGERIDVGPTCPQCGCARPNRIKKGEVAASMPRWLWNCILTFKRFLIKLVKAHRRINGALSWK